MKKNKSIVQKILLALIIISFAISGFLIFNYINSNNQQFKNADTALIKADNIIKEKKDIKKKRPPVGTVIGKMYVKGLTNSMPILEGEDLDLVMNHGVGHIESTPLPGEKGNSALSAHRETFFRPLENMKNGDIVVVEMPYGTFKYKVVDKIIVKPDQGNKVYNYTFKKGEGITLITCYPFNPLSSPDKRIAFFAEIIN